MHSSFGSVWGAGCRHRFSAGYRRVAALGAINLPLLGAMFLLAVTLPCAAAVPPTDGDCDGNGVQDAEEIRADALLDFNENGCLDECERRNGDTDLSESIDFGDLAFALLEMGNDVSPADVNVDGEVDFLDIALINLEFGPARRTSVPRRMLTDLIDHQSHLDFVILGDSNATFSADGSRGYAGGFFDELTRRGVPLFATGLLPTATSGTGTAYPLMGLTGESTTAASSVTVNDSARVRDGWRRASTAGISLEAFNLGSQIAPLRLEGRAMDWAYLPEDADVQGHAPEWIGLAPSAPGSMQFGSQCSGALRLLVARMPCANANKERSPLRLRLSEGSAYGRAAAPSVAVSTDPMGPTQLAVCEAPYPANAQRGKLFATYAVDDGSAGPVGILLRSLYRTDRVPGFAINVLQNFSGGTSSQIAASIADDSGCGLATLKTYLQELRSRQIAAGGQGRVLVFMNMGINNASATTESSPEALCASDASRMITQLDRAWRALGYPETDLGFLVTASHDGGIARFRADIASECLRRAMAGNRRVSIVSVDALTPGAFLASQRMFAGNESRPNAHLNASGYRTIAERVFERLIWGMGYQPN